MHLRAKNMLIDGRPLTDDTASWKVHSCPRVTSSWNPGWNRQKRQDQYQDQDLFVLVCLSSSLVHLNSS